jgi:hypothetical protein
VTVADRYKRFARSDLSSTDAAELGQVDQLADQLRRYLDERTKDIAAVHVFGAQSRAVQGLVGNLLRDQLGFGEERVIPADGGLVTQARPDFFYRLSEDSGIIAEVERGGTTTNNHDLKDLWKAHISPDARHLFLVVPVTNTNEEGRVREHPFRAVSRRMATFFGDPRREVDVVSVHVFGYGARENAEE